MTLRARVRKLSLQGKISLAILGVLVPVFTLLTISVLRFMKPLLVDEARQVGVSVAQTIANEIVIQRMLSRPDAEHAIEDRLREFIYLQPNLTRIDVYTVDQKTKEMRSFASTVEEAPESSTLPPPEALLKLQIQQTRGENPIDNGWEIYVPIKSVRNTSEGVVHVLVSTQLVSRLSRVITRVTILGAALGIVFLFFMLNAALRRTIENDRKLREAESQNVALSRQLHETERELMNTEKFAIMGQLTASFAHEVGTPLNAIGGHLGLLKEEIVESGKDAGGRIAVIEGQVAKITGIVRNFLQSTAKPSSQSQLVDAHDVIERTLAIVRPRVQDMGVALDRSFNRDLGPIRVVPIELEQVLLNLVTNSLDSIRAKAVSARARTRGGEIAVVTRSERDGGKEYLIIDVRDTGEGIPKDALGKVLKPFYTTKAPGEGTGLGLAICQDIMKKYGGSLALESEVGAWTKVELRFPYGGTGAEA